MADLSILSVKELGFLDITDYLYHGTYRIKDECDVATVKNIDVKKGYKQVDFGQGFYVCTDRQQAERRARYMYRKENKTDNSVMKESLRKFNIPLNKNSKRIKEALVVRYKVDTSKISDETKIKIFKLPDIEWLKFIFNNRKGYPEDGVEHNQDAKYHIVYGYMADGVFKKITDLLNKKYGELSSDELLKVYEAFTLKQSKIETQVSFHQKNVLEDCLNNGDVFTVKI